MGNPEFNGKKFDIWSNEYDNEHGVWNNDMHAKQFMQQWNSIIAPSKEDAIEAAKRLNDNRNPK